MAGSASSAVGADKAVPLQAASTSDEAGAFGNLDGTLRGGAARAEEEANRLERPRLGLRLGTVHPARGVIERGPVKFTDIAGHVHFP